MLKLENHPAIQTDPDFDAVRIDLWRQGADRVFTDLHLETDAQGACSGYLHEGWWLNNTQVLLHARIYRLRIDDWQVFGALVDQKNHGDKLEEATKAIHALLD